MFSNAVIRGWFGLCTMLLVSNSCFAQAGPRSQPGTDMRMYAPEQHDLYDGHFVLSAARIFQVGRLGDPPGWDHIDNNAERIYPVQGSIELNVNEIDNTGTFVARIRIPHGDLVIELDRFHEFSPCQDGGVAAFIYEHGDSGCGDTHWPKSLLYVPVGATDMPL